MIQTTNEQTGAEQAASADVAKGLAEREAAKSPQKTAQSAGEGAGSGAAKAPEKAAELAANGAADELKQMRQRLEKLEQEKDTVQAKREGADAVDSFIREHTNRVPTEMLRRLLPPTTDKKALFAAMDKVEGWLKGYLKEMVKGGFVSYVNIGGGPNADGVTTFGPMALRNDMSPTDLIRAGLARNRGQSRLGD